MKHQYFGDVNDYRKFGLLRCIADATGLRLGIVWLITADDGRSDGEFRRYLREPQDWRHHDPPLYDRLSGLLQPGAIRHVEYALTWDLLPDASYFAHLVSDSATHRRQFLEEASQSLANCPILFLDPDNGIEVKSIPFGARRSSKYIYWRELTSLFQGGHSLLVYQHYPRISRAVFEADLVERFRSTVGAATVSIFSTAHVAFFLALQEAHVGLLPAITVAVRARWAGQLRQSDTCTGKPERA